VSYGKTAEPIDMSFGMCTPGVQRSIY